MSLPLHHQICLPEEDLEPELLEFVVRKTKMREILKGSVQTEKEVNNKMLELLNVKTRNLDIKDKTALPSEADSTVEIEGRLSVES